MFSAMPSSMCWPRRRHRARAAAETTFSSRNTSACVAAVEDAAPVDPGAEVGRDRHVGRGRHDAARELAVARARARRGSGRSLLGRHRAARGGRRECVGHRHARRSCARGPRCANGTPAQEALQLAPVDARGRRSAPIPRRRRSGCAALKAAIWSGRHQAGVVVLVAGERQAEALDRVGDEAGAAGRPRRRRNASSTVSMSWPARLVISRAAPRRRARRAAPDARARGRGRASDARASRRRP